MSDEDVFTLPEYECESPSDAGEIKSDDEEVQDQVDPLAITILDISRSRLNAEEGQTITDIPDDIGGLNSTILSEANSNYCESITSCSTGILTDTDHEVHSRRRNKGVITVDESSEEDDEEIFFSEKYKQRVKRKRASTEEDEQEEERDSQSDSSDMIIAGKVEAKPSKRPGGVLYSHEHLSLKCEWMFGDVQCSFPVTENKYDFAEHVKRHSEHMIFTDDERYQCQWRGCKATLEAHKCVFHIYFHAYHTALKSIGTNCAKRDSLQKCSFPTHGVNAFPKRETNRVCLWNDCRESFVNMFAYEIHIEHHMEKFYAKADQYAKLPCEWNNCNPRLAANRRAMMLRHLLKHTQLKQLACPTCGHMFKTRIAFKTHCHRLKKNVDLQCNLCKKYFSTESLLHSHVQNHVYTKQCNMCQAMCLSASTLATHIRYKHLDGQHHLFKCDQCSFKTISNHQLTMHKRVHLPKEKRPKLICDYSECTYTCLCRRTMYDHIKAKHENAKYVCHVCTNNYLSSTALSKHLKKKHSLTFPVGTDRFRYRKDKEGNYRLQTVRYESMENEDEQRPAAPPSPGGNKMPRYSLRILQDNGKVELIKEESKETKPGR